MVAICPAQNEQVSPKLRRANVAPSRAVKPTLIGVFTGSTSAAWLGWIPGIDNWAAREWIVSCRSSEAIGMNKQNVKLRSLSGNVTGEVPADDALLSAFDQVKAR